MDYEGEFLIIREEFLDATRKRTPVQALEFINGKLEHVGSVLKKEPLLPTNPIDRKGIPLASGVLDYFTAALLEIAKVSFIGNEQHNPGEPLHWARGKSVDQADTLLRHFVERGTIDTDGMRHSAKMAWRALALLQQELEDAGAPVSRGSILPEEKK